VNRTVETPVVFTAMSKLTFYYREMISAFVFRSGAVPINPFMLFGYFLCNLVERDQIRAANNLLIKKADELWVFGPISDGVAPEIALARRLSMPIRYFAIIDSARIEEISEAEAEFEPDVSPA
jgi:hypothetical protein